MRKAARIAFVVSWVLAEVAATVALERLGHVRGFAAPHHAIGRWALRASTEDLVAVAARTIGLTLSGWLLLATLLSTAHRVVPGWKPLHRLDFATPPHLRRALDRALVLGLGASLAMGTASAASAAVRPTTTTVASSAPAANPPLRATALDQPVPRAPVVHLKLRAPAPLDLPVVRGLVAAPPPPPPMPTPVPPHRHATEVKPRRDRGAPAGADFVIVRPGDNLWLIARRALAATPGTRADDVATYWRRLIAANIATLRSRDPNLIFPGERIALPDVGTSDTAAAGG
jgi:nucleoid-associated protein YgaU